MDGDEPGSGLAKINDWIEEVTRWRDEISDDRARMRAVAGLERLKSACYAAQADLTADRYAAALALAGRGGHVDQEQVQRSVAAEVGLARRESPTAAVQHVRLAQALTALPAVRACLRRGDTDEYRAMLVARELGCLSAADRAKADELVADKLPALGCRSARSHAAGVVARLDPEATLAQIRKATRERHVAIRSVGDGMVRLSAVLPLITGVAAYAGLCRHADRVAAGGGRCDRTRSQLMADELVARLLAPWPSAARAHVQTPDPDPLARVAAEAAGGDTDPVDAVRDAFLRAQETASAKHQPADPSARPHSADPSVRPHSADPSASPHSADPSASPHSADPSGRSHSADAAASADPGVTEEHAGQGSTTGPTRGESGTCTTPGWAGPSETGAAPGGVRPVGPRTDAGPNAGHGGVAASLDPPRPDRADADPGPDDYGVPETAMHVDLHLVMTDRALFDGDDEPAVIPGHGPVPAALARRIAGHPRARVFLRRLYTDPRTRRLTDLDERRRLFPDAVRRFLLARDQICRTPWCDAPIRHADHVVGHASGGPSDPINGQGLCAACNYAKQADGWSSRSRSDGSITVTTPTALRYASSAPEQPRSEPWTS